MTKIININNMNSLELKQYRMNNINILKVRVLTEKKLFHCESSTKVPAVFIKYFKKLNIY